MRFKRLIKRSIYYPVIKLISLIELISKEKYMKLLISFLKANGIMFTGEPDYISSDVYFDDFSKITIGKDCVISKKVVFLTHDFSPTIAYRWNLNLKNTPSPKCEKMLNRKIRKDGEIKLNDNCFIGLGTIILPGTEIGQNVIVGSGSVVKGKIPDNCIVIGNPAKRVMTLEEYYNKNIDLLNIV